MIGSTYDLCRSPECGKRLAGMVAFCPYCGSGGKVDEACSTTSHGRSRRSDRRREGRDTVGVTDAPREMAPQDKERPNASSKENTVTAANAALGDVVTKDQMPGSGFGTDRTPGSSSAQGTRRRRIPWVLGPLVALSLVVGLSHFMRDDPANAPPVAATALAACPASLDVNTSIVLDVTPLMSDSTREEIIARAKEHMEASVGGVQRINVFTTSVRPGSAAKPIVSVCISSLRLPWLFTSDAKANNASRQSVLKAIETAFSAPPPGTTSTPISQALADISLSQYARSPVNTLVVFSDMMEDTPKFSLNACRQGEEGVAKYRESRRGALERPEFGNTAAMLNVIPKAGMTREALNCRNYFWRWFFSNLEGNHAKVVFNYLPGGSGEVRVE